MASAGGQDREREKQEKVGERRETGWAKECREWERKRRG
jgi:hypothetical protein